MASERRRREPRSQKRQRPRDERRRAWPTARCRALLVVTAPPRCCAMALAAAGARPRRGGGRRRAPRFSNPGRGMARRRAAAPRAGRIDAPLPLSNTRNHEAADGSRRGRPPGRGGHAVCCRARLDTPPARVRAPRGRQAARGPLLQGRRCVGCAVRGSGASGAARARGPAAAARPLDGRRRRWRPRRAPRGAGAAANAPHCVTPPIAAGGRPPAAGRCPHAPPRCARSFDPPPLKK